MRSRHDTRVWSDLFELPAFVCRPPRLHGPAGLLLAATSGPDMALFLSRTLNGGKRFGLAAPG
jgi:hypothetical protein